MKTAQEIISELKHLDLSLYPYTEARSLIDKVGGIGGMVVTLHAGKSILRARPNYNSERFQCRADLSYKPQKFNTSYQRASSPYQTMFYASLIPDNALPDELKNITVVSTFEVLSWLRDKTTKGYQKITYGIWEVIDDIQLFAIIQNKNYHTSSSYTRELYTDYEKFLEDFPERKSATI